MPAVYIIIPRCLLPIMQRVHGSGSRSYCLSCRAVLNHHAAGLIAYQVAGLIAYQVAGLIAYQVAGLLSIMPRGYSAGGSALSFRGVLLFSIMPRVYIIMPAV